jgi:long-subunit fatty acid transport protein
MTSITISEDLFGIANELNIVARNPAAMTPARLRALSARLFDTAADVTLLENYHAHLRPQKMPWDPMKISLISREGDHP